MAAVQRVGSHAQFQALLARRPCARSAHFALHHVSAPDGTDPAAHALFAAHAVWLGALVPKRCARRAVRRNLIRRQIRALGAVALQEQTGAWLIRLRAGYSRAAFPSASSTALKSAVRAELQELLRTVP